MNLKTYHDNIMKRYKKYSHGCGEETEDTIIHKGKKKICDEYGLCDNCAFEFREAESSHTTFHKVLEMVKCEIDDFEKENTQSLKTEDIIKKKIVIADYIKWDKFRKLKKQLEVENGNTIKINKKD